LKLSLCMEGTMKARRFKCRHCHRTVTTKRAGQQYCGERACQRARKQEWSREKYKSDADYRINQKESTDAWLASQGGAAAYYRDYRRRRRKCKLAAEATGPSAEASTVCEATHENHSVISSYEPCMAKRMVRANRDASLHHGPIKTGRYEIITVGANRDAVIAEIRLISTG
jgi:hypothetical protein